MPEEQRRILEMLASQRISVEQADRLLEAVTPGMLRSRTSDRTAQQDFQRVTRDLTATAATDGGAYLRELRAMRLYGLGVHEVIALKANGVDGAYVRDLHEHGLKQLQAHELIALKANGVDGAYLRDLRDAGLEDLGANAVIACKAQGIDGAYIRRMRSAGFAELAAHDLIALKAQGIDASENVDGGQPDDGEAVRLLSVDAEPEDEPEPAQS